MRGHRQLSNVLCAFILPMLATGCASIPPRAYGVNDVSWKGVEQVSEDALEACLATKERAAVALRLGLGSSDCGSPPFDEQAPALSLFSWPWTEWPVYDEAIFDIDRKRIERWYRARGFYDARVRGVAFYSDAQDEPLIDPVECTVDDCELELEISVDEGDPVRIERVAIEASEGETLPPELLKKLRKTITQEREAPFDEVFYEADKSAVHRALTDSGYAYAAVIGRAELDRVHRRATVIYTVTPGPSCVFGDVRVEGHENLSDVLIDDVANIDPGEPYESSALVDAERAIYALGAFSAVRVEPQLADNTKRVVDVVIRVTPGRLQSLRLGVGVMSGVLNAGASDEVVAVPEWDIHLRAAYRNENFLGGMRRLRIEERPRLIMLRRFPSIPDSGPRFGNALDVSLEQPRFIEARTTLFTNAHSDLGPDPFFGFFRHVLATKLGLKRNWFGTRLQGSFALAHDVYALLSDNPPDTVSSYRLPFVEQQIRVDLRNDAQRPARGVYFSTTTQEALRMGYASWDYVRVLSEVRAYQRLPLRIVLAQRFAVGGLFILGSDPALDPTSEALGPQEYRLRGGGANSNRGFGPGRLGVGINGGKRRWEASLEARLPLGADVGLVLFLDAGDVNAGKAIRFKHLNAATGFGLRYFTPFAPIRLDLGWRIPGWQRIDAVEPESNLGVLPNAAHLTIGEAF